MAAETARSSTQSAHPVKYCSCFRQPTAVQLCHQKSLGSGALSTVMKCCFSTPDGVRTVRRGALEKTPTAQASSVTERCSDMQ
jgi:hypothetical protein